VKIYEFQAKEVLKVYDLCVPRGVAISSSEAASQTFLELGCQHCVVKAQIHAGGRGKSGGILFAKSPGEAKSCAEKLLGSRLSTYQTSQHTFTVKNVLIEEVVTIQREVYLAVTIDRSLKTPVVVVCAEGGTEIEEIAQKAPDKIFMEPVDIFWGPHPFQIRRIASELGISTGLSKGFNDVIMKLFRLFMEKDCSLLEINPLVITRENNFVIVDVKMDIDDNALFRHPELERFASDQDLTHTEVLARKYRLNYIDLEGDIGCLVNGAGLAMATMDIIKLYGGEPANFLDVGGNASPEQVKQAFEIILTDKAVNAILVNIFGGIMKCDVIANGIIQAVKDVGINKPLIVRLEGTNVDKARKILDNSGLRITFAQDMKYAVNLVVKASKDEHINQ